MKINNHEVTIITRCPFCGHANEVEVNEMDYLDWQDGMLVQDAFPYLSANEREMLVSGICPACWASTFGSEGDSHFEDLFETSDDEDYPEECFDSWDNWDFDKDTLIP